MKASEKKKRTEKLELARNIKFKEVADVRAIMLQQKYRSVQRSYKYSGTPRLV